MTNLTPQQRDRINGLAPWLLERRSAGSVLVCRRCSRSFSAFDLPHYSLALESHRIHNLNRGRALVHARACARRQLVEEGEL